MGKKDRTLQQRPVIGITGNDKQFSPSWLFLRLSVYLAGGRPRRIHVRRRIAVEELDGIIISGGDDISPEIFGEAPLEKTHYDPARDELETDYIRKAVAEGIPLLGICRGHQLLNAVLGGKLHTQLKDRRKLTSNRRTLLPRKKVTVFPGTELSSILRQASLRVNSLHDQAISTLAGTMKTAAVDRDRIIQAVESTTDRPIIGVQWHPEYLFPVPSHFRLFRWLISSARRFKAGGISTP